MRVTSSSLLAICVATSNALPALSPERRSLGVDAPRKLPDIDPSIPGCANTAFIDIWPPSNAELRCRGFKFDENNKIKPHVATEKRQPFPVGDQLPPIDESIPGCKDTAFIDIYPPSAAELRCRGVSTGDDEKTPPVKDKENQPTKDKKKQPWQVGEELPPIDDTIPGCKDVAFIAIYPPSEAEIRCRGINVDRVAEENKKEEKKQDPKKVTSRDLSRNGLSIVDRFYGRFDESIPGCKNVAFPAVFPPSQAELRCRGRKFDEGVKLHDDVEKREFKSGLSIKDRYWGKFDESIEGCKGKSFLAVIPPSQAELRCRRKGRLHDDLILPKA